LGTGCQEQAADDLERSLVSVEWLAQRLDDVDQVLVHIGSEERYDEGHIPGARYLGLADFAVRDSVAGLRNELPSPEMVRDKLEAIGVSDHTRIVVYADSERPLFATRFLFTLDLVGLGDNAVLLDGGLPAWQSSGHAVTSDVPEVERGTLSALSAAELVVDSDWIMDNMGTPGHLLVDARSYDQYIGGEEESEARQGHIPGAVSVPMSELYDKTGQIRHPAELERIFASVGYQPGDTVVGYCVTGVLGSAITFAARELGYPVLLYDGSIEDWRADSERPLQTITR
jgi:thiosulfate/3-mercaptopyruvate sulfurtransferase